jgi:hypothetical protein
MREGLPQFRVRPDFEVMRHPQEAVTVNPGKEPEPQRRDKPGAWSLSLVAIEAGAMRSTRLCWRSCNADPRSDASNVAKPAKHRGPLSRTSCRGAEARGWIRYPAATQYLHSFEMGLIPHHDGPRSETDIHELAAFVER